MRKPTVYIFVNKSLGMSIGKVGAQTAHAMSYLPGLADKDGWLSSPHQTVLIMEARNQQHLENIRYYLKKRNIETYPVIDEGVNETENHVMTTLATEVVDKDLSWVQDCFSSFKTYRDKVRVTIEVEK